jgi:hypothetical protein
MNSRPLWNACGGHLVSSMHAICINNRLAAGRHLVDEILQEMLRQGIPCLLNGRTNSIISCDLVLIMILYPILHPILYSLDGI